MSMYRNVALSSAHDRRPFINSELLKCVRVFVEDIRVVFIKLKNNKIFSGFNHTQAYIILFYLHDDMFRSIGHHQAIFTKLRIKHMQR
jgi:hypothetical protein